MRAARDFLQDLRYSLRGLLKTPVMSLVAVLALALGVGVNASSFITVNAIILHPLPFAELDRIVALSETIRNLASDRSSFSPGDFADLQAQSHSFAKLAAYRNWPVNLTSTPNPERLRCYAVSSQFFSLLGVQPQSGHTLEGDQEQYSRLNAVVVSDGFWRSRLGSQKNLSGVSVSLAGKNYRVAGVMPDEFDFPLGTQIWAPLTLKGSEQQARDVHNLQVLGLLKPGISLGAANAEVSAIAGRLAGRYPDTNAGRGITSDLLRNTSETVTNRFIVTIFGAAGFVLLLACANIANLQLARAVNRQKEIAVRAALGASRFQIARQLSSDSLLLSLAGGLVGLLLASWNNDRVKATIPPLALRLVPGLRTMHVDSSVVLFTIAVSLLAGLVCSIPGILQLVQGRMRMDLTDVLRERSGNGAVTAARSRLRSSLIIGELALAFILLIGAGLMVGTFQRLLHRYQGFDPTNVLTMQVFLSDRSANPSAQLTFLDEALRRFAARRQVKSVALYAARGVPENFLVEGQIGPNPGEVRPKLGAASSAYLQTLRIPLLEGRFISPQDRPDSLKIIVLSQSVARRYWPDRSPLGRRVRLSPQSGWLTVVGVCGDRIDDWFSGVPAAAAYVPYTQSLADSTAFFLRTGEDPLRVAGMAQATIHHLSPDAAVFGLQTLRRQLDDERSGVRAAADTMSDYAVIALLLAATGIYAVVSFFVASRTHDIGVRMALGAGKGDVLRMTMAQAVRLTGMGLLVGLPIAIGLARLMSSILYGVVEVNGWTFAEVAGVLCASALLASYLPAWRATRIDPLTALRNE